MELAVETEGLHPATVLFLEALQWLHEQFDFENVLDMGCGNGILSLIAAGAWEADVTAADISPKAVEDTQNAIEAYGLQTRITVLRSDGFTEAAITQRAPYDLILFNLLAEPIVRMAREVQTHIAPEGIAVLGGLRAWEAEGVKNAYEELGFEILMEFAGAPWHVIILRRE